MKLFQINENDLATLEKLIPELQNDLMVCMTNATRVRLRQVKSILSNVRWNYGPPSDIEVIDVDYEIRE